jgi:uncharacterized protein (DUF362 family)
MGIDRERRKVMRALVAGAIGLAAKPVIAGDKGGGAVAPASASKALVARGKREGILGEKGSPDAAKLEDALGKAVARAAGEKGPVEAMRRLFKPRDVVGIKLNCIAGKGLSPDPKLVGFLAQWLTSAGLPAQNVVIWERTDRELIKAGYMIQREGNGVRCFGTNDEYEKSPREWGAGGSCFARVLVEEFTALINVGVLKDHDLAGVSAGLKNWYGTIHNPNKHHEDGCNPYIPHLAAFPLIREKLRLTVIDAMAPQCHGGPARQPRWSWPYHAVLASTDPVAIDAVGWDLIDARRNEVGLDSLAKEKREPRFIAAAAKLGLGEADLARIRVEDV